MSKLKRGNELCDTCNKPYIALPGDEPCKCEVDPTHTDPVQIETGIALKCRHRLGCNQIYRRRRH